MIKPNWIKLDLEICPSNILHLQCLAIASKATISAHIQATLKKITKEKTVPFSSSSSFQTSLTIGRYFLAFWQLIYLIIQWDHKNAPVQLAGITFCYFERGIPGTLAVPAAHIKIVSFAFGNWTLTRRRLLRLMNHVIDLLCAILFYRFIMDLKPNTKDFVVRHKNVKSCLIKHLQDPMQ